MRREIVVFFTLLLCVRAWDDEDLEVFDVVEEVNKNFYEFMGVSPEATRQEIKAAFNSLTLKLHPDKNPSLDADEQFRNLVSVHNILKHSGKRAKYDEVLKNGLPNWRSAVYYYRHVRRMGLAEGALILFLIVSVGQYLVSWAAYVEKRYTAEQILSSRVKKKDKKSGFESGLAEVIDSLPRPSLLNTLPCQIPRGIWWLVTGLPFYVRDLVRERNERIQEEERQKQREEDERLRQERIQAEMEAQKLARGTQPRRRRFVIPEKECLLDPADEPDTDKGPKVAPVTKQAPPVSGGLWTDDDLAELIRLVKKYPGGTPERWERIAEVMGRSVPEVTHMAHKVKDNAYRREEPEAPILEPLKKVKTRKPVEAGAGAAGWSQEQQASLENALAKHTKRTPDRWQRIAAAVPGKTQEECMQRCRYLSEMLKKSKEQKEDENQANEDNQTNDLTNGTVRDEY